MKYAYIQHAHLQPNEDQEEFLEIVLQADGLQQTNWQKHEPLWYPPHSWILYQPSDIE